MTSPFGRNSSRPIKKVLVTGGAGYVGSVLVPRLMEAGYSVIVYDLMLFGRRGLKPHPCLEVVEGDIRDTAFFTSKLKGVDTVIHLACISNDPSFELEPELSRSINYDCFEPLVASARSANVRRFIYASTSSVYGVSDAEEVTEEHPLVPLTDYNRYKGLSEPILLRYQSREFTPVILRPATVCGYSPRMRLDLTVNILTNHAVNKGIITVFGGKQRRPHIHIEDLAELYVRLVEESAGKIAGETFNVSYRNYTVEEIALMVRRVVEKEIPERAPIGIVTSPTRDQRSYHVSTRKIEERLGYRPQRSVEDAVRDLVRAFKEGKIPDAENDIYYNVNTVKKSGIPGTQYLIHRA